MKTLRGNVYCPHRRVSLKPGGAGPLEVQSFQSLTLMGTPIWDYGLTLYTYAPPNLQVHHRGTSTRKLCAPYTI